MQAKGHKLCCWETATPDTSTTRLKPYRQAKSPGPQPPPPRGPRESGPRNLGSHPPLPRPQASDSLTRIKAGGESEGPVWADCRPDPRLTLPSSLGDLSSSSMVTLVEEWSRVWSGGPWAAWWLARWQKETMDVEALGAPSTASAAASLLPQPPPSPLAGHKQAPGPGQTLGGAQATLFT